MEKWLACLHCIFHPSRHCFPVPAADNKSLAAESWTKSNFRERGTQFERAGRHKPFAPGRRSDPAINGPTRRLSTPSPSANLAGGTGHVTGSNLKGHSRPLLGRSGPWFEGGTSIPVGCKSASELCALPCAHAPYINATAPSRRRLCYSHLLFPRLRSPWVSRES